MLIEVIKNGRLQGRIDDGRLISWTEEFKALWDDFQANPTDMVAFVAELEEQGYEADALEIDPFPFSGSPWPIAPVGKLSVVRGNRFEFRKQLGGGEEDFGWASLLVRDLRTDRGVGYYGGYGDWKFSPARWHWMAGTQMANGGWRTPKPEEIKVFNDLPLEELERVFGDGEKI